MIRHAPAFDKQGLLVLVPRLALCTGREAFRIALDETLVDCESCLAKLATLPAKGDVTARNAWFEEHGATL